LEGRIKGEMGDERGEQRSKQKGGLRGLGDRIYQKDHFQTHGGKQAKEEKIYEYLKATKKKIKEMIAKNTPKKLRRGGEERIRERGGAVERCRENAKEVMCKKFA